MRLSPLRTDLTLAWLRTMVSYRAAGTFGRSFFPRGGILGAGKGSRTSVAAGNGSILLALVLDLNEALEEFEDCDSCDIFRLPLLLVAQPILVGRTGILSVDELLWTRMIVSGLSSGDVDGYRCVWLFGRNFICVKNVEGPADLSSRQLRVEG